MKELMDQLIEWYKTTYYQQGDSYYISYSQTEPSWTIGHSNDYPMQHGKGGSIRLSSEKVEEIINNFTIHEKK